MRRAHQTSPRATESKTHGVFSHKNLAKQQKQGKVKPQMLFLGDLVSCLLFIAKQSNKNRMLLDDLDIVEFAARKTWKRVKWTTRDLPTVV